MVGSRCSSGSASWYLTMIDSKLQRPSICPSSAPLTSYGIASSRCTTVATSSAGTKRNSASLSMKRLMSQGHAIRSTLAFFRVTHFIVEPPPSCRHTSRRAPRRPDSRDGALRNNRCREAYLRVLCPNHLGLHLVTSADRILDQPLGLAAAVAEADDLYGRRFCHRPGLGSGWTAVLRRTLGHHSELRRHQPPRLRHSLDVNRWRARTPRPRAEPDVPRRSLCLRVLQPRR